MTDHVGQTVGDIELKVTTYGVADGVATITFNRPDRLNAWTGRMHHEYRAGLAAAAEDPAVRVIVVTGAGRGFCVGADTRALNNHLDKGRFDPGVEVGELPTPGYGLSEEYNQLYAYHFGILKPIIAAINGPAAGLGLVIACFCDLRFAIEGAKLTVSASRLGLPSEYGLSWLLPRIVGLGRAADLLMSSRVILADEAERMGLVNRVFLAEDFVDGVTAYARDLATSISPMALMETKRQLYADMHRGIGAAVADAEATLEAMVKRADYREGVRAWIEKRPPNFAPLPPG